MLIRFGPFRYVLSHGLHAYIYIYAESMHLIKH